MINLPPLPPPYPLSDNTQSQMNTQSQAPPQPPPSQPLQPLQQPSSHNTRSRMNTQSQVPLQTPPLPEDPQLQEFHSTQPNGTSASESTSSHRRRGMAKGLEPWGTGQKLHVDFNQYMQPYGVNQQHLATHLGIIAQHGEQVPLIYEQRNDLPKDILDYIWKEVEDNTDAPPEYTKNCLINVRDLWRKWKSYVKTHYYNIWKTDEERLAYKPLRVDQEQWKTFITYWETEKQQLISAQNKQNRQFQELDHRTGRTPHVQIKAKMEEAGEDTNQIGVFKRTRTPKNGNPMNPETQVVIEEMESRRDAVPKDERTPKFIEEVFTHVIGPDGHGSVRVRVRTYGIGVTPKVVFGKGTSTEENKLNNIREEVRAEYNAKLDEIISKRNTEMDELFNARITAMRASIRDEILAELRGGNGPSSIGNVPTSSSVHRLDLDGDESFSHEDVNEEE